MIYTCYVVCAGRRAGVLLSGGLAMQQGLENREKPVHPQKPTPGKHKNEKAPPGKVTFEEVDAAKTADTANTNESIPGVNMTTRVSHSKSISEF